MTVWVYASTAAGVASRPWRGPAMTGSHLFLPSDSYGYTLLMPPRSPAECFVYTAPLLVSRSRGALVLTSYVSTVRAVTSTSAGPCL